jgi:predicted ArsR family transcriptional regulator
VKTALVDAPAPVRTGARRRRVLEILRESGRPHSAAEVAAASGLHLNTARFHLDGLVRDRLAERTSEPRRAPGRPRILYSAHGPAPGPRSYALLAEMLTEVVATLDDGGPAAAAAGRAWGRQLVERSPTAERVGVDEAVTHLNSVLDAIGFRPHAEPGRRKREIDVLLRHCPFREVAERHTDVVCALHLGLMQGALDELAAPVEATTLEPLVRPDLCIARLSKKGSTS